MESFDGSPPSSHRDGSPRESTSFGARLQNELPWWDGTPGGGNGSAARRSEHGRPNRPIVHWYDARPRAPAGGQRSATTILIGGLTETHDLLNRGMLEGLGYRADCLPCPDAQALALGREFCSRGMCNPAYFTVGNLLKRLLHLRDVEKMSVSEIARRYLFLNAGACGPCRFGAYSSEYRRALREAGFEGFRVWTFQQMHGFRQEPAEGNGFDVTPAFARSLVKALVAGDVLNALGYRIRPYELRPGQTDHALGESRKIVYEAFRTRRSILRALLRCRPLFRAVEVDRFRVKPKVMVIGEFWAMTTEGDGNHHLQRFLEAEGAEIQVQSLTTWMLYMLWQVRYDTRRRLFLPGADLQGCGLANKNGRAILRRTWLADKALRLMFYAFAGAVGLARFRLTDMEELASLSRDFYHPELRGGEGHMEVGKLIHVATRNAAHMVVSVKPFGCLPSSGVSDGVQPAVLSMYPEAVFCPVETTGDNAVSFQSRILMSLFKAHRKAREEFEIILNGKGFSLEEAQARLTSRHRVSTFCPQRLVAGTAANMLLEL